MSTKLFTVAANIIITLGALSVILVLTFIFFDSDKPIETIPMYTSDAKLVDSGTFKHSNEREDDRLAFYKEGKLKFTVDITKYRVITLPDRDMNWQELLWEAYQKGYDQGVKDSQTSTEK